MLREMAEVSQFNVKMMQYLWAEITVLQQAMVSTQFAFRSLVLLSHFQFTVAVDVFTLLQLRIPVALCGESYPLPCGPSNHAGHLVLRERKNH